MDDEQLLIFNKLEIEDIENIEDNVNNEESEKIESTKNEKQKWTGKKNKYEKIDL